MVEVLVIGGGGLGGDGDCGVGGDGGVMVAVGMIVVIERVRAVV